MMLTQEQLEALAQLSFKSLMKSYLKMHPHGPDLTLYTWEMQCGELKTNYQIMINDVLTAVERLGEIRMERMDEKQGAR